MAGIVEGTEVSPKARLGDWEGLRPRPIRDPLLRIGWMQQEWNLQSPSDAMLPEDAQRSVRPEKKELRAGPGEPEELQPGAGGHGLGAPTENEEC